MSTLETKRRLLLSKWRGEQDAGRENERKCDCYVEDMREVLEQVKYWMHEPLVLQMPMRDPRVILRRIEDVLG